MKRQRKTLQMKFLALSGLALGLLFLQNACTQDAFVSPPYPYQCVPGSPSYPMCLTQSSCYPSDPNYPYCQNNNTPTQRWCDLYPQDSICQNSGGNWCTQYPNHPACNPSQGNFCDENPNHDWCSEGGSIEWCQAYPDDYYCQEDDGTDGECDPTDPENDPDCEDDAGEQANWTEGATTQLTKTNAFEDFADMEGLETDSISDLQVNILVSDVGTGSNSLYGGDIYIGFSNRYEGFQETSGVASENPRKIPYNRWVTHDRNRDGRIDIDEHYLKLFFEFRYGAMIVVVNINGDNNDLNGVLFYRKHDYARCSPTQTQPLSCRSSVPPFQQDASKIHCWEYPHIPAKEYYDLAEFNYNMFDCRAFLVGQGVGTRVDITSSLYPDNSNTLVGSYKRIGRFEALNPVDAGITIPFAVQDATVCSADKTYPDYAVVKNQCLPSCGTAGGNASGDSMCGDVANHNIKFITEKTYEQNICCTRRSKPSGSVCSSDQPSPSYKAVSGQCLPSCGTVGGNASGDMCSDTANYEIRMINIKTHDQSVCCHRIAK